VPASISLFCNEPLRFVARELSKALSQADDSLRVALLNLVSERAFGIPGGPLRRICNPRGKFRQQASKLRRGGFINGLIQIVGRLVVAHFHEIVERFHFGGVRSPAELKGERRDALGDEVDLIAADETVLVGLFVELHFDVIELSDGADVIAERGFSKALNLEVAEGEQRQEHVHVEIGDDVGFIDGWFSSKVGRAELPHLFCGQSDKKDGALRTRACGEEFRGFDDGGDSGGVVHRAVIDGVSVDGFAYAEVIEVCADDDEFVFQAGIGAFQFADYVLRIDGGILCGDGGDVKDGIHVEGGQGFACVNQRLQLCHGVIGEAEELICVFWQDGRIDA
jgi:hypothetical protein